MASNGNGKKSSGLAEATPHYHGHRQRLRQRFLEAGSEAVSDYELLELVLFRAIPQRDLKPLAKELIATFGSFGEVIAAPRSASLRLRGWATRQSSSSRWSRRAPIALRAAR